MRTPRLAALLAVSTVAVLAPMAAAEQPAAAVPTCNGLKATIVGTKGNDRIFGTNGPDVIVGLGGDDVIRGRRGDDRICGKAGADVLVGGPGDDRINGGLGSLEIDQVSEEGWMVENDTIRPGTGDDQVVPVRDTRAKSYTPDIVSYADVPGPVRVDLPKGRVTARHGTDRIAVSRLLVIGSPYDDVLLGGPRADSLSGGAGDDTLVGGDGNDELDDGWGMTPDDDRLFGGAGDDELTAGRGRDTITGGTGDDDIRDRATSPDRIDAGAGDDIIHDQWVGGPNAAVRGGAGRDLLWVELEFWRDGKRSYPPATIDLRSGVTTIEAGSVTKVGTRELEWISFDGGPLTYHGTDADDSVEVWDVDGDAVGDAPYPFRLVAYGYGGDDDFNGSGRNDLLDGGDGTDRASAREGVDRCISIEVEDDCEVSE